MMSNRFTKPRIIVFSIIAALILATDIWWFCMIYTTPKINPTLILEFIVSPILLLFVIALVIFSNLKLSNKIGCGIIILILIFFVSFFWLFFGAYEDFAHYQNDEISDHYTEVTKDFPKMPTLAAPGEVQNTDYYLYRLQMMIFMDESYTIICKYDEDEYQKQKELLEQNYVFQSEPLIANDHTCQAEVTVDGYLFRMVAIDSSESFIFPKSMMFIATNDDTKEIVYIAYENLDLDYIDSLESHITDSLGWKYFR